jgi:hypothetical protein
LFDSLIQQHIAVLKNAVSFSNEGEIQWAQKDANKSGMYKYIKATNEGFRKN